MLVFFILINILIIVLLLSKIKIEITSLKFKKEENEKIKLDDFIVKIYLELGKFKWLKITINKAKLSNFKTIKKPNKNNNILKIIKLERLDLKAVIGFNNIIILSYVVTILNIIISIFLAKKGNVLDLNNYRYKIIPCKTKEIFLNVSINCIFSIKIVNIINILLKKRGKKYGRTSNRVFNGNCYE